MKPAFLDTNILVYAFSTDDRARKARELMENGAAIGVQSLNEFAQVATAKMRMPWPDVREALDEIRLLCSPVIALDIVLHERALDISERYSLRIFDATLLAAALNAPCETFYSENMQHGLVLDGSLRIENPFLA